MILQLGLFSLTLDISLETVAKKKTKWFMFIQNVAYVTGLLQQIDCQLIYHN